MTLKEIKNINAIDITNNKNIKKLLPLDVIGVSTGIYGVNGCLLKDKKDNLYKITKRNSNLFYVV